MLDKIETEHVITWLNEDGIFISTFTPNMVVTLEMAKKLVESRLKISNGVARPGLSDIRNLKRLDNQAREYLETEKAHELVTAAALVTRTPVQNLIANFYLKFRKAHCPARLFTDKKKALRWLSLYTDKQLN